MNKTLRILLMVLAFGGIFKAKAQNPAFRDSVLYLCGVFLAGDSLRAIPSASIIVEGKGRGTFTSPDGVFSIAVLKGDKITFSCIGFKDRRIDIPANLTESQYSVIQLMVSDTVYLPATILKPRPTREQFERDFVNNKVSDDMYEVARKNTDEARNRILLNSLPSDGREAVNYQLRQQANKYYYAGQIPPMNILNPGAWGGFIKSWKRGDYKRKK